MKPTIDPIKIKFVTKVKHELTTNLFSEREVQITTCAEEIHIFEICTDDKGNKTTLYSFCGKSHTDIGEETKETDKRPDNLPLCKKCESNWKNDSRSPWKAWIKAVND